MTNSILDVRNVRKHLGLRTVLRDVSLTCAGAEVVVIKGPNGTGKSTLLRVIAGIIEPDRGDVRIAGSSMRLGGVEARQSLGYVPDATDALPNVSVADFVALVAGLKGHPVKHGNTVNRFPFADLRQKLNLDSVWVQRVGTLSFGQRKRVCMLAAMIGDPPLLVLDEPVNGLDPEGVQMMHTLIADRKIRGHATVLTTNDLEFGHAVGGTHFLLFDGQLRTSE